MPALNERVNFGLENSGEEIRIVLGVPKRVIDLAGVMDIGTLGNKRVISSVSHLRSEGILSVTQTPELPGGIKIGISASKIGELRGENKEVKLRKVASIIGLFGCTACLDMVDERIQLTAFNQLTPQKFNADALIARPTSERTKVTRFVEDQMLGTYHLLEPGRLGQDAKYSRLNQYVNMYEDGNITMRLSHSSLIRSCADTVNPSDRLVLESDGLEPGVEPIAYLAGFIALAKADEYLATGIPGSDN